MPAVVPRSARPDARPDISPDALLVPLAPYEAYAADVDRLDGRAPLGAADDAWLTLAHTLARAAALPRAERAAVCAAGARMMSAVVPERGDERQRAAVVAATDAVVTLAARLSAVCEAGDPSDCLADTESERAAVSALQTLVAQEEQAGAFLLAFSTLAAMRRVFAPAFDARSRGLLLAQQGRVARQLGAFVTAKKLYRAADRAARSVEAADVSAIALLGAGVLASMRGNYPEARTFYRRALKAAVRAGAPVHQRASHQGLLYAAFAANDIDTALAHGWAAIRGLPEDAIDERAETLLNLGEVGRQAGEHRAALGACLSAIEFTDLPRLRLPALGTAARAAAALGEFRLLDFLARDVERTVARSGQQFENARVFVELAEAFDGHRDDRAIQYAARARALAVTGAFHEIATRADAVLGRGVCGSQPRPRVKDADLDARSPRARAVLRTLEALPAARRYEELVAC